MSKTGSAAQELRSLSGQKILVVDDEPEIRAALRFEFEFEGAEVIEAENGNVAVKLVHSENPDVVVSDIRMPECDGVEMLKKIKAKNSLRPLVVLITGQADISRDEAYQLGAEAVIFKPFDPIKLVEKINQLVTPIRARLSSHNERQNVSLSVDLSLPSQLASVAAQTLNLGRGGMFVGKSENLPEIGEKITFCINFADGIYSPIVGSGLVRWVREPNTGEGPAGFGLEFLDLEPDSLEKFIAFLEAAKPSSYIPEG